MAGNLELRTDACLTLVHLPWEIKIIQAQSEWNGTGNAILLHFLAFMAGNEEVRLNEVFCVLQFKVMATKSIQVSGVNRDRDQFYSVLSPCCVAMTLERFFLWGAIIFVLFVEQFIEVSFGSDLLGLLGCQRTSSVQKKKNPHIYWGRKNSGEQKYFQVKNHSKAVAIYLWALSGQKVWKSCTIPTGL